MGDFWTPVPGSSTDADAIHDNVSGEIATITEKASPISGDLLLIEDSAASNAKKRVQVGNLPGGIPAFSGCLLRKTSTQSTNAGSNTDVTWATEVYDTDGYANLGANADRFTVPTTGYYEATLAIALDSGSGTAITVIIETPVGTAVGVNRLESTTNTVRIHTHMPPLSLSSSAVVKSVVFTSASRTIQNVDFCYFSIRRVG